MTDPRPPSCCKATGVSVRCERFSVSFPIDTDRGRAVAIENGFMAPAVSRWRAAFSGRTIVDSGDTTRGVAHLRLVVAILTSAAAPLAVTAILAVIGPVMDAVTFAPFIGIGVVLIANACHELGHLLAFTIVSRRRPHVHIVARLGFAHIVRPRLSPPREVAVIVSGPLLVASCSAIAAAAAQSQAMLSIVFASIGVGHLTCLLLPVGDGANLREALGFVRSHSARGRP